MKRSLTEKQREQIDSLVSQMTIEEKCSQLRYDSPAIERLGIPEYNWWNECLHGVARAGRATIFPQAIGLAATFNTALIEQVASAIADEARAKYHYASVRGNRGRYRGLTFWTPNINIFRDPRWGRGMETYGEDPFLTATLGTAFVEGLQGFDAHRLKLAACAKHYAVHSGPEGLRHEFDAEVSLKDLHETYLPAFEALVSAGVESVMGAYNRVNGHPANAHPLLIGEILREKWGFDGHVVSDCWAIRDFHEHHGVSASAEESAARALKNGCDLNCGNTYRTLSTAIEQGLVGEREVDVALRRLLRTRALLGILGEDESAQAQAYPPSLIGSEKHRHVAHEAAVQSIVLLKNDAGLLPLGEDVTHIYVTGPNAASIEALIGNYYGINPRISTILEGVAGAIDESVTLDYRKGGHVDRPNANPVDWISYEASLADVVIAAFGLDNTMEGEEGDAISAAAHGDRETIEIPENQVTILRRLRDRGAKVVLVLTGGSPIAFPEDLADTVLFAWYPGQEAGPAIAEVLFGKRAPGGRLPITFPRRTSDLPPYEDYSMRGRTYRYAETDPLFPFGFGLSYTGFEYTNASAEIVDVDDSSLGERHAAVETAPLARVAVEVGNTGECTGDEVVQVYVRRLPVEEGDPLWTLCAFERITLAPGETRAVGLELPRRAFERVLEDGAREAVSGSYEIVVGGSSPGMRARELGARFAEPVEVYV